MRYLSLKLQLGKFGLDCAYHANRFMSYGNQYSASAAFIGFFRYTAKLCIDYSKYDAWEKLVEHSGVRFMHKEFCIISDRPEILLVNSNNQPHCVDGPFCRYRDGTELYSINGIRVPQKLALTPSNRLDAKEWLQEENVDIRREAFRKIGIEKVIKDLGAEVIDTMECPVGGKYDLLLLDIGIGKKKPYLRMSNPSLVGVSHIEGVKSGIKTVPEALAWRNGTKNYTTPLALT